MSIGVLMICSKNEPFIDLTLKSIKGIADQIIIVGDPNKETRKKIFSLEIPQLELIWRDWDNNFGRARNLALRHLQTSWILSIDADEVISDNAYLLKEYARKDIDCYDIKYTHFIYSFGTVDNTTFPHIGIRRFYKKYRDTLYTEPIHEVVNSNSFKKKGFIEDVILFHLGDLKGLVQYPSKYRRNLVLSEIHTKEFLRKWLNWHLFGTYPVRPYDEKKDGKIPKIIKDAFEWGNIE